MRAGDRCRIVVDATNEDGRLRFDELIVRCGRVVLHQLTQQGTTIMSSSVHAMPLPPPPLGARTCTAAEGFARKRAT